MSNDDRTSLPGLFGMNRLMPGSAPGALGQSPQPGGLLSDFLSKGDLTNAGLGMPLPPPSPSTAALAAALRGPSTELHTNSHVAHIAGIGASHPEQLTNDQVQSLCGEVLRHIRRMKGEG